MTKSKRFFIDVETTGVNSRTDALIQLGGIIEIDGEIKEKLNLRIKPFPNDVINDKALEVNGITREELSTFSPPKKMYKKLTSIMSKYVDKFNKLDKFHFIGYNSRFDDDFVRSWFKKNGDKYYGSYFFWPSIDVANIAAVKFMDERHKFSNFKLMTVAKYAGVEVDPASAHDAMYDIEITRDLFYKLMEK